MLNAVFSLLLTGILFASAAADAAIVLEEGTTKVKRGKVLPKTASDALGIRAIRRMGLGFSAQGALGAFGGNMEMNFSPTWSGVTGFGGGAGYQAFTVQAKRALYGEYMMPYFSFGYSRWYSIREGKIGKTNPAFLSDKFVTPEDREAGEFDKHLIFPAFGLQYIQLNGEWAGFSVYAEIMMLVEVQNFVNAPTGSLGMTYYF